MSMSEPADADDTVVLSVVPSLPGADPEETGRPTLRPVIRATPELQPGTVIGDYVVENTLGTGGCGHVYGARHKETARRAAIKVLRAEMAHVPTAVPRFIR